MTRPEGSRLEWLLRAARGLWDDNSATRRVIGVAGLGVIIYSVVAGTSADGPAGQRLAALVLTVVASALFLVWLAINRSAVGTAAASILGALALAGGLLTGLEPGAGMAFAVIAVYSAGRRLQPRTVVALTTITIAVLTAAALAGGRLSGWGVLVPSVGLTAAALGGLNWAARERVREQAELLVARGQVVIEERTRSAALAERTRIAREIHDLLAHSLSGLAVQLEAAHVLLDQHADPARVANHLDRARGLARSGLEETRRALHALRGEALPTAELLAELVETHRADTGPVELVVTGTPRTLPADVGLTIYRITQEALTNIRRHALGARAKVHLAYEKDSVQLTVSDHASIAGRAPAAGNGYGLVGMQERAELLGGELSAGPTPDGWRVGLRVPT